MTRFGHTKTDKVQNSPHPHRPTQYGAKVQYADDEDNSPPLNPAKTKYIQAVAGTLLYYGQVVDSTILTSLSSLATEQNKPTQKTMAMVKQLLGYCKSQEEAIITYDASSMILNVHSDAGYLNKK
jgi:hypothetical protein